MAIARVTFGSNDNTTTGATTTGSITNFTVSGSDTVLYVGVMSNDTPVLSPDPTVIWDSAGANQDFGSPISKSTGTGTYLAIYRLKNPTAGSNKTISLSGLSASVRDAFCAVLFSGVDQTTPNDSVDLVENNTTNTGTLSSSTITSPAGDWIVSFFARSTSTTTPSVTGGGNTLILAEAVGGNNGFVAVAEDADGADDTIDWAFSTSVVGTTIISFNLNAAATGVTIEPGLGSAPYTGRTLGLGFGIDMPDVP